MLDGVALSVEKVISTPRFKCETPFPGEAGSPISLKENLDRFLSSDDDLVICILCWESRYGDKEPYAGVRPGVEAPPDAIQTLFLNADKVVDF